MPRRPAQHGVAVAGGDAARQGKAAGPQAHSPGATPRAAETHAGAGRRAPRGVSGGAGRPFAADFIAPFYRATVDTLPAVTVGLAGGFNADNVEARIVELRATLGSDRFCIDAEGGLRERQEEPEPVDRLSLDLVEGFIQGAVKGFRRASEG